MTRIGIISIIAFALFAQIGSGASPQLESYKARRAGRSVTAHSHGVNEHTNLLIKQTVDAFPSFTDTRVNSDSEPETFRQQFAEVAVFPDGSYVVVWEDDRNGDYDIYAQRFTADDQPEGDNVRLVADFGFTDQRMPSSDVNEAGQLAVSWVDGDGEVYGCVYDQNLDAVTGKLRVTDSTDENLCQMPDVAFLDGGRIGFVWEDSREEQNVLCQLYSPLYEPLGGNFPVNTSSPSCNFWSPEIVSGGSHGFAVSWDVITSAGSGVMARVYAPDGAPISGLISLPDPSAGSYDRFQTAMVHLDETGYAAFWIDTRDSAQTVYGQMLNYSGNKNGSNIAVCDNDDCVCWDLSGVESGSGRILVTWASYGQRAEILGTLLNADGERCGANVTLSDPLLLSDRFHPRADFGSDSQFVAVWCDLRSGEIDTYIQKLDSTANPSGPSVILPSIETGAHQTGPDIALFGSDAYIIAWCDMRHDQGDVMVQFGGVHGALLSENQRANLDAMAFMQSDPAVDAASNGEALLVWLDAREYDGVFGTNIFGRRYNSYGTPLGGEIVLNDDISLAARAEPDAAQSSSGPAMAVWCDARNGHDDIYCQRLGPGGSPEGSNFKINTDPSLNENRSPRVGMSDDGRAVVGWRSVSGGDERVCFQLLGTDGTPAGVNTAVPSGGLGESQTDFSLAVNPVTGEFVIAWISESDTGSAAVMAQRFSDLGEPMESRLLLSNLPVAGGDAISVAIDASGNYSVSWTDSRSGYRRVYITTVRSDNVVGMTTPITDDDVVARGEHSSLAMTGTDVLAVWADNRESGKGYDIYLNSHHYTTSSAADGDDPAAIPSGFVLAQNYPNPFNPTTVIRFHVPNSSQVKLQVCNVLGQVVKTMEWNNLAAGWHEYEYDASDQPSGIYLYRLQTDRYSESKKMLLLK